MQDDWIATLPAVVRNDGLWFVRQDWFAALPSVYRTEGGWFWWGLMAHRADCAIDFAGAFFIKNELAVISAHRGVLRRLLDNAPAFLKIRFDVRFKGLAGCL